MLQDVATATWFHAALTAVAFGVGLLVGWLWWGRQFVRARLTRDEALSIMQEQLERELASTDDRIALLRSRFPDYDAPRSGAGG